MIIIIIIIIIVITIIIIIIIIFNGWKVFSMVADASYMTSKKSLCQGMAPLEFWTLRTAVDREALAVILSDRPRWCLFHQK
jgi:hypothetical protein